MEETKLELKELTPEGDEEQQVLQIGCEPNNRYMRSLNLSSSIQVNIGLATFCCIPMLWDYFNTHSTDRPDLINWDLLCNSCLSSTRFMEAASDQYEALEEHQRSMLERFGILFLGHLFNMSPKQMLKMLPPDGLMVDSEHTPPSLPPPPPLPEASSHWQSTPQCSSTLTLTRQELNMILNYDSDSDCSSFQSSNESMDLREFTLAEFVMMDEQDAALFMAQPDGLATLRRFLANPAYPSSDEEPLWEPYAPPVPLRYSYFNLWPDTPNTHLTLPFMPPRPLGYCSQLEMMRRSLVQQLMELGETTDLRTNMLTHVFGTQMAKKEKKPTPIAIQPEYLEEEIKPEDRVRPFEAFLKKQEQLIERIWTEIDAIIVEDKKVKKG